MHVASFRFRPSAQALAIFSAESSKKAFSAQSTEKRFPAVIVVGLSPYYVNIVVRVTSSSWIF